MPVPEYRKCLMDFTSAPLSQAVFFSAKRDYPACHLAVTAISSYRVIITRDAMHERIIERSGEVSLTVDRQTARTSSVETRDNREEKVSER